MANETCSPAEEISLMLYLAAGINVGLSLTIIIIQLFFFYMLSFRKAATKYIDECGQSFQNGTKFAEFIRMPIAGVLVMAEVAGIPVEEVIHEYEKDSMERRALIYGLFGRNHVVDAFVDWPECTFIRHGYEGEEALLEDVGKVKGA